MKVIDKIVGGWKNTDKYPCPECGKKLSMKTQYTCIDCDVKIKLKVKM